MRRPLLWLWIAVKKVTQPFWGLLGRHLARQHARFDRCGGVDTAGELTLAELGLPLATGNCYQGTPVRWFRSVLGKLSLDWPNTVFIDLGCGKGRALLLASEYPFRSIIGVEISDTLCRIAIENVDRYHQTRPRLTEISVAHSDIADFDYEEISRDQHLLVYLANPCGETVLAGAFQKLARLAARGQPITIIYLNPSWDPLQTNASWLALISSGKTFFEITGSFIPYVVFSSRSAGIV